MIVDGGSLEWDKSRVWIVHLSTNFKMTFISDDKVRYPLTVQRPNPPYSWGLGEWKSGV